MKRRGIVLVTCLFLALLLFTLTVVQVARVNFLMRTTRSATQRTQVSLLARSAYNMAMVQVRRAPGTSVNLQGRLGGGTYQVATTQLQPGVWQLRAHAEQGGSQADVVGIMSRLEASTVPLYVVRGPRFNTGTLPTFWYPAGGQWKVLNAPSIPPTSSYGFTGNAGNVNRLQVGVDLSNQPFFLTFPPQPPWTQPAPVQMPWGTYIPTAPMVTTPNVYGSFFGMYTGQPPPNVLATVNLYVNNRWEARDISVPLPPDGTEVVASGNRVLASRLGRVLSYEVERGAWTELVPPANTLVGSMKVDPQGNLFALVRDPNQTTCDIARWNGTGWTRLPPLGGAAFSYAPAEFTVTRGGTVVARSGMLDPMMKFDGTRWVPVSPPSSLSTNLQKQMLGTDRDGNLLGQLVDRGGGFGNDFRVWKLDDSDPTRTPQWSDESPPNSVYSTNGVLTDQGSYMANIVGISGGGNSDKDTRFRKVWEYR